ncbi:MAG: YibE/F family protein [Clostridia bacterium]|nr:YibE/F family protein [Clostridia bacterium]
MKKSIILIILVFLISYTFFSNIFATNVASETDTNHSNIKAKVVETINIKEDVIEYDGGESVTKTQYIKIKVLSRGEYKDKEYEAEYSLSTSGSMPTDQLKVGQKVYISINADENNNLKVTVMDVYRIPYLLIVIGIFFGIIFIIGRKKGIKTIISLVLTIVVIVFALIPMIMKGYSAIISSILICIVISIITLMVVGGINRKTIVAIIGTMSGVVIAGILAIIVSHMARITGLSNEEAQMLFYVTSNLSIDIKGIFFASILIGTVGATMDIAMSISSAMTEISERVENISASELIISGLNVGKDAMGTMSNTLILAYVGESLNLILLLMLNNSNVISIINSDFIASEILRGICGTIGMMVAIPITTVVFGLIYAFTQKDTSIQEIDLDED